MLPVFAICDCVTAKQITPSHSPFHERFPRNIIFLTQWTDLSDPGWLVMNGNNWMRGFGGIVPSPRRRLNAKWSSSSTSSNNSSSTRKISSTSREIYTQPTTLTELTMSEINGEVFIWVTSSQVPSNQSPGGCIACTGFLSFSFFATFFDGFYLWACFHGLPPSTQSPGCNESVALIFTHFPSRGAGSPFYQPNHLITESRFPLALELEIPSHMAILSNCLGSLGFSIFSLCITASITVTHPWR